MVHLLPVITFFLVFRFVTDSKCSLAQSLADTVSLKPQIIQLYIMPPQSQLTFQI